MAVRSLELGDVRYSGVCILYINHSEFSWYIKQCPLLGRGPLLGASVNGELTVFLLGQDVAVFQMSLYIQLARHFQVTTIVVLKEFPLLGSSFVKS